MTHAARRRSASLGGATVDQPPQFDWRHRPASTAVAELLLPSSSRVCETPSGHRVSLPFVSRNDRETVPTGTTTRRLPVSQRHPNFTVFLSSFPIVLVYLSSSPDTFLFL